MLSRSATRCADVCREAIAACEACVTSSDARFENDEKHCADLCRSSIRLCGLVIEELELHSMFSIQACALCAVICRACGEECEMRTGSPWRDCAAACLRAAAECHAIATSSRVDAPVLAPVVKSRTT